MTLFAKIPKFPTSHYSCDVGWDLLEHWLSDSVGSVDLDPDFQRSHVWTEDQQVAFVEFKLRGGESGGVVYWNNPDWENGRGTLVLVDGKQRMEAARRFMRNDLRVFGVLYEDFKDKLRLHNALRFSMRVAILPTRADVLRWYLAINAGGTPHSPSELYRVKLLLDHENEKNDWDL